MNKPKIVLTLFISLVSLTIATISCTFAWFLTNYNETTTDVSGSVLESYFDKAITWSGDPGSETNPYVITTPKHYENLVKLYTQKFYNPVTKQYEYFSDKDYHFEIGKDFNKTGEYKVHDYDDYGADKGTTSTVLNLGSLASLEPIGNDAHPFNSTIIGHDIKVTNFTVKPDSNKSQSYGDVGIFGYVKTDAYCEHVYWDNFVIDATGAKAGVHTDAEAAHHDENFRIGYLAGHIKTYESFDNCYVNNCKINSPKMGYAQQNDYGYYGMVEKDKSGSGLPEGKNYSYSFDSEAWHNYFNTNYSSIQDQALTLRNTEESSSYPKGEYDPPNSYLNEGVIRGDTGDLFNSYYLQGHTVSNTGSYSGRDFSLSTTGYVSGKREVKSYDYQTKISNDGATFYDPDPSATLSARQYNENFIEEEQGQYHYVYDKSNKQWNYYFCDNHYTKAGDKFSVKFDYDQGSETAWGSKSNVSHKFMLYLDNDAWGSPSLTWDGTCTYDYWEIVWKCSDRTIELPLGQHVAALIWYRTWKIGRDTHFYYSAIIGDRGNKRCDMVDFHNDVTHDHTIGKYVVSDYVVDLTDYISLTHSWQDGNTPSLYGQQSFTPDVARAIYGKYNANVQLYYVNSAGTAYTQMKDTTAQTFSNALFYAKYISPTSTQLWTTVYLVEISEEGKERHYLADEEEIKATGYNARCIDLVGGGVGFYYYNLGTLGSIKICRIDSELKTTTGTIVKQISDGDVGKKFYAPGRCNQSLVLYIRNVGSAIDGIDDYLGKMTFNYYQIPTRTVHPSYKKGATSSDLNYYDFSEIYGDPQSYKGSNIIKTFENVSFTESICKKACYCCLDANGKILGTYNKDGSYGVGMTKEREEYIETYVMVIGSFTNASYANWKLWIRNIDFEYKAAAGEGGTFGSVGYRSQGDSLIEDTIINFNMTNVQTNIKYSVEAAYTESNKTYRFTIVSSYAMDVTFYNHYPDDYIVYVNGALMDGQKQLFKIPATS